MEDYDLRERFEWADIFDEADWDAPEELNVAHEVCDRHPDGDVALEYAGATGERETLTFGDLAERSNRFVNVLDGLVECGDRVFSYIPWIPEHARGRSLGRARARRRRGSGG